MTPYFTTIDTTALVDGPHTFFAVAHDAAGNYATSSSVSVTVDNTAPVRSVGLPNSTLALSTASTDISLVTNENATCKYSTSHGASYNSMTAFDTTGGTVHSSTISGLTNGGMYTYYVKCQDGQGNTDVTDYGIEFGVANVVIPPDTTAPSVSITTPGSGDTISGTSNISVTSSDNTSVAGVQLYIDLTPVGTSTTTSPYTYVWNTDLVENGTHTIVAVAHDAAGNYATSSIPVTVNNFVPPTITPTTVTIQSATSVSTTTATLNATITNEGYASSTVVGFEYGTSTSYGSILSTGGTFGLGAFNHTVSGLTPSTTYHARGFATNSAGTASSSDVTFTTSDLPTPSDTTPPGSPTNFVASSTRSNVHLSWTNPTDSDFSTVTILGSTGDYMTDPNEGGAVVTGLTGTSWDLSGVPDGAYYFSIFAYDATGNVSVVATSTTVVDTTVPPDTSAPIISGIATSTTSTSATISWTTNQSTNATVVYGVSTSYGSTTISEGLTTNHSVTLTNLVPCTTYHYIMSSQNVSNISSNNHSYFITAGCTSNAPVVSSTSDTVSSSEGKVISNASYVEQNSSANLFTINVPAGFSSTTNNSVFEIQNLDPVIFFNTVSTSTIPQNNMQIGSSVVHLTSYIDNGTPLVVFDNPITVTMSYLSQDVQGIDENSLKIYRYDAGVWTALSNCVVDKNAHTVTCQTSHFSDFSIFGQIAQVVTPIQNNTVSYSGGGGGGGGGYSSGGDVNIIHSNQATITASSSISSTVSAPVVICRPGELFSVLTGQRCTALIPMSIEAHGTSTGIYVFNKNLSYKDISVDVLYLQKYLNTHGFIIATSGIGSPGNENQRFGPATQKALIKFQKSKGIKPAVGTFGPITRKYVNGHY